MLLRALGYSTEELLNYYYDTETDLPRGGQEVREVGRVRPAPRPARHAATSGTRTRARSSSRRTASSPSWRSRSCRSSNVDRLPVEVAELVGKVAAHDVIDETTGEVILQCNEEVTEAKLDELREHGIKEFKVLFIDNLNVGSYLRDTLIADKLADARRGDHGDLPAPAPG